MDTSDRRRLTAPSRGVPCLELIVIESDELPDGPLRFVNNNPNESIRSEGDFYQAFPVNLVLPNRGEDLPRAQIEVSNVNRRIGKIVDEVVLPLRFTLKLVWADDPDTVIEEVTGLTLRDVRWSATTVQGELRAKDLSQEPAPGLRVTRANCQALFRLTG